MLIFKKKLLVVNALAFFMLMTFAACESKTETKVETTPVVVKDTVVKVLDTSAVSRPRQMGN